MRPTRACIRTALRDRTDQVIGSGAHGLSNSRANTRAASCSGGRRAYSVPEQEPPASDLVSGRRDNLRRQLIPVGVECDSPVRHSTSVCDPETGPTLPVRSRSSSAPCHRLHRALTTRTCPRNRPPARPYVLGHAINVTLGRYYEPLSLLAAAIPNSDLARAQTTTVVLDLHIKSELDRVQRPNNLSAPRLRSPTPADGPTTSFARSRSSRVEMNRPGFDAAAV